MESLDIVRHTEKQLMVKTSNMFTYAYELLAKLRHLTLTGYEDGYFEWVGTNEAWNKVKAEEDLILLNWEANELWN